MLLAAKADRIIVVGLEENIDRPLRSGDPE
jgi:hypothetical protein